MLLLVSTATAQAQNKPGPFPVKVDRDNYPAPEYRYPKAEIGLTAADSKPDFPPDKTAPKGSPNILLVLVDDEGFGCPSTLAA